MTFASEAISLEWNRNNLILKRGASSLVIRPENVQNLRIQDSAQEFENLWRTQALENREARRVFEAWERKDKDLVQKIFREVTDAPAAISAS